MKTQNNADADTDSRAVEIEDFASALDRVFDDLLEEGHARPSSTLTGIAVARLWQDGFGRVSGPRKTQT